MYLHDKLCVKLFRRKAIFNLYHRKLDDIRRGSLNGHVSCNPFAEGTEIEVAGRKFRKISSPSVGSNGVAAFLRGFNALFHKTVNSAVMRKIAVDILLRFFCGNADIFPKAPGADSVNDSEVDRLCAAPHLGSYVIFRNSENLGCGLGVDIRSSGKSGNHIFVIGKMRQNAKFYLGIVRVNKGVTFLRGEESAHFCAQLRAYRNILKVRFKAAYAACSGFLLVKACVNSAIRSKGVKKSLNVSGIKLRQFSVFKNFVNGRVVGSQILKNVGVCGIAALCLFLCRKSKVLKKHDPKLFRRKNVEFFAAKFINAFFRFFNGAQKFVAETADAFRIDFESTKLH